MSWFEDLTECNYFGEEHAKILNAVGWLESGKSFSMGKTENAVYKKLCDFSKNRWMKISFRGWHECNLCQFKGELCDSNIFIPSKEKIYVCPDLITHYINAHSYCPPEEFRKAVLFFPRLTPIAYCQKILENGGKELLKKFDEKSE